MNPPVATLRRTHRTPILLACLLFTSLPFLFVSYVPVTDLPQQLAQARLFWETLAGAHAGEYVINWRSPNTLVYLPLVIGWKLLPPRILGLTFVLLLALAWVSASHWLAAARSRPVASAAIVSVLAFNLSFHWGFLSFLLGWPLFVLLLDHHARNPEASRTPWQDLRGASIALLLFVAHALWFLAGVGAILLMALVSRCPWRVTARRLLPSLPVLAFAGFWFPQFSRSRAAGGYDTGMHWRCR